MEPTLRYASFDRSFSLPLADKMQLEIEPAHKLRIAILGYDAGANLNLLKVSRTLSLYQQHQSEKGLDLWLTRDKVTTNAWVKIVLGTRTIMLDLVAPPPCYRICFHGTKSAAGAGMERYDNLLDYDLYHVAVIEHLYTREGETLPRRVGEWFHLPQELFGCHVFNEAIVTAEEHPRLLSMH